MKAFMKECRNKLRSFLEKNYQQLILILFKRAKKTGISQKDVEDVAHSAFEHILIQIDRNNLNWVLNEDDPGGTLYRLLVTTSFKDAITKLSKQELFRPRSSKEYEEFIEGELKRIRKREFQILDLDMAIERLPEDDQKLLKLHYVEGWKCKAIAKMSALSEDTVRQRLCRIRKKLYEHFSER